MKYEALGGPITTDEKPMLRYEPSVRLEASVGHQVNKGKPRGKPLQFTNQHCFTAVVSRLG